ncbi:pumilio homolog 3 isoform X3 [Oryza sativa Japonica Group]|uniref:pumilio homolog 3 isoform X3 n=1 Tax=Oryza sativa subsp. japonica TaxID=39947 RepID=UPI00339BC93F
MCFNAALISVGGCFRQQKLQTATPEEKFMVFEEIMPHAIKLVMDIYGSYVLQKRVPKYFDDPIQEIFLEEIIEDVYYMTKEQYANNVVQHILQHGKALVRSLIIKRFIGKVVTMSKQKLSSSSR